MKALMKPSDPRCREARDLLVWAYFNMEDIQKYSLKTIYKWLMGTKNQGVCVDFLIKASMDPTISKDELFNVSFMLGSRMLNTTEEGGLGSLASASIEQLDVAIRGYSYAINHATYERANVLAARMVELANMIVARGGSQEQLTAAVQIAKAVEDSRIATFRRAQELAEMMIKKGGYGATAYHNLGNSLPSGGKS